MKLALRPIPRTGPSAAASPAPWAPLDDATIARLTWAIVGFGVFLRIARYLQRFPLWHDEAFLAASFLDRGLSQVLRPLDYLQVAPPLFVGLELAVVKLLGFSEWSLRLIPALAGLAALVLFQHLARLLLRPWPALVAIGFLAVAYSPLRHGNEVKPYAVDLLATIGLLTLGLHAWREPDRARWFGWLAAVSPVVLLGSLPSVFVAGGVLAALAGTAWRSPSRHVKIAYVAFGVSVIASFGLVLAISAATPASEVLRQYYLLEYWSKSFPPIADGPLAVARWFVAIQSGNLVAYPVGGEMGASVPTLVAMIAGVAVLYRRGLKAPLAMLLLPFALNLAAAFVQRYPYGGEARIAQHLAPAVCLLGGLGASVLVDSIRQPARRARVAFALLAVFPVLGVTLFVLGLLSPYHLGTSARSREFARWFWASQGQDATLVCAKADLHRDFEAWQWVTGISAEYLCNQRIYSPPGRRPASSEFPEPTADRPVRCVVYNVAAYRLPWNKPAFRDWVDPLRQRYRLDRIDTYEVNAGLGLESWKVERYHVLEFRPRSSGDDSTPDALDRLLADQASGPAGTRQLETSSSVPPSIAISASARPTRLANLNP